jgi:Flp pilus assembly protein TadG
MMRRLFPQSDSGTAMVEFAIIVPVFVLLLIGLIEVGRFAYFGILASNAARAGVQYGAQNTTTAEQTTAIRNAALQDGQNLSNWQITPTVLCSVNGAAPAACTGTGVPVNTIYYVQVQVSGTFSSLLNYPGIPHSVPINGSAIMRVANQ